jgi:hypothetical protein
LRLPKSRRGGNCFRQKDSFDATRYIVTEEAWSISSEASEHKLLGLSAQASFSGGSVLVAYASAKLHASEFNYRGLHEEGDQLYWWGRNEGDRVNRRFVIKPAPPSSLVP